MTLESLLTSAVTMVFVLQRTQTHTHTPSPNSYAEHPTARPNQLLIFPYW